MARLPSERAPWDKVVHMYETGCAPKTPSTSTMRSRTLSRAGSGRARSHSTASSSPRSWRAGASPRCRPGFRGMIDTETFRFALGCTLRL